MKFSRLVVLLPFIALTAVFNGLVLLEVDSMFRTWYSFLFLITIPGMLFLYASRYKARSFGEFLTVSIGMSVAALMFVGYAVNSIAFELQFYPALRTHNLLVGINVFLGLCAIVSIGTSHKLTLNLPKLPSIKIVDAILTIVPVFFIPFSVFGANRLNNGEGNEVTVAMLIGMAVYFLILLLRKKTPDYVYTTAIYATSLSLLFMLSLRSSYLTGWDIIGEFNMFQITKNEGFWNIAARNDAYYACLSITILPTLLSFLTGMPDLQIYKVFYQIIFALVPVIVYFMLRRHTGTTVAFIAVLYILIQPFFIQPMTGLMRQQIAFLFFALMLYFTFGKHKSYLHQQILFVLAGASMVVSHYSTTYAAIALLVTLAFVYRVWIIIESRRFILKLAARFNLDNVGKHLTPQLALAPLAGLVLFAVVWYGPITNTYHGLVQVVNSTLENIQNTFKEDVSSAESRQAARLTGEEKLDQRALLREYYQTQQTNYGYNPWVYYPQETYEGFELEPWNLPRVSPVAGHPLIPIAHMILEYIHALIKLFFPIGVAWMLVLFLKKQVVPKELIILNLINAGLVLFMLVHPSIGANYNVSRLYLQTLMTVCIAALYGGQAVFFFLGKRALVATGITLTVGFLLLSGVFYQLIGGTAFMHLHNYGDDFDKFYFHEQEVVAVEWLDQNRDTTIPIHADDVSSLRLQFGLSVFGISEVVPPFIQQNAYVYARYANVVERRGEVSYKGNRLLHYYPFSFLDSQKNLIYSNGGSVIYR